MGLEGVGVHLRARDPVTLGQDLAHPELGPQAPINVLHERGWERARPSPCVGRQGHPAHHLGTAGDHQVVVVRCHTSGGEVHGLLGRTALAVDGRGRHRLGQSGRDPPVAGKVRALLPHLAHTPADDVVDPRGIHTRPLNERGQCETQEVRRVPVGERAAALTEGRAHDVDDDRFPHVAASSNVWQVRGPSCRVLPPRLPPTPRLSRVGPSDSLPRHSHPRARPGTRRSRDPTRRPR